MMKKIVLAGMLFLGWLTAFAQRYGNEWINYSQQYFKIKVWQNGIYRVNRQNLVFSGVPLSTIDPRNIQLFHNGRQEHIHIEGEQDGSFDNNDFIEFYGEKNDGAFDTVLYADRNWQPNPHYSNFTDTSVYFLTWTNSTAGLRYTQETDTSFGSYSPAPFCLREAFYQQPDDYNYGYNNNAIDYTESEGWCAVFGYRQDIGAFFPITVNLPVANVYTSGPSASFSTSVGGINNLPHRIAITYAGNTFADNYYVQSHRDYQFTVPANQLTSPNTTVSYSVPPPAPSGNDYNAFYYVSLTYPHTFDLENSSSFLFGLPDQAGQTKSRLDLVNFNGGNPGPVFYDLTNHRRITVIGNGSTWRVLVPNDGASSPKKCIVFNPSQALTPGSISGVNYITNNFGYFNNFSLSPIDSAFIIITSKSIWSEAQAYRDYRNLTTGNSVLMADANELTDQFAYGIQKHPYGIRNFSKFILDNWSNTVTPPQHLLLIGKSINPKDLRKNPSLFSLCMVPSYGLPSSDILLTSGLSGTLYDPAIATGRICARTGNDVLEYLQKVQEYEQAQAGPPQPWMKEILHFGGGNDPGQQAQLSGYLDDFAALMEGPSFGGDVTTYLKFSTGPIVINQSDSLQAQIDSGVAVMTFFGHASGSGFDQSTDEPSAYNNRGRYPLVVANSCYAGDFHTSQKSVSEKFVLEPEKAAIGFIASVGLGVPQDLFLYSHAFFDNASRLSYGTSVGQLMQKAIRTIQIPNAENIKSVCQEMSLNGDPYLKINHWDKPDYSINESSISFSPSTVTADMDTFSVIIKTRNTGKAVTDSFQVKVKRYYPDGSDSTYTATRSNCYYQDAFALNLKTGGYSAAGINRFEVIIDEQDSIDEYDNFQNNRATTSLFINSGDIVPVYPPDFSIHPVNHVTLKASTSNPMASSASYLFQIDTVDLDLADSLPGLMHSPLFTSTVLTDSGGVISWDLPNYQLLDSAVYFWRVANDSIVSNPGKFKWRQSSFQYIPGKSGWAQSDFFQFKSNEYDNMRYDTLGRQFSYVQNNKFLTAFTNGLPDGSPTSYNEIGYKLNGVVTEYNGCGLAPAVYVAVLDSITLEPWNNCGVNFGQANVFTPDPGSDCTYLLNVTGTGTCRGRPENVFQFRFTDTTQMNALDNFIQQVPSGNYILAYSWYTANYSALDPSFHSAFGSLGFNTTLLNNSAPFIYLAKKGTTTLNQQVIGQLQNDRLNLSSLLSTVWNRGSLSSVVVGPAARWESLHWNQVPKEAFPGKDQIHLAITGLNSNTLRWDTLVSFLPYTSGSKDTALSWIPASLYNYLKLSAITSDDSLRTPPQISYWRIYYDEVPECALNPNNHFDFYTNPLNEGDTLRLSIAVENIGNLPMDSLDVDFYLYGNNRQRINLSSQRLDSLRTGASLHAALRVDSTFGLAGDNSLWVEANPYNNRHQQEKYHFNNLAEIKFRIDRDIVNPVLDVTFDGVHIMDGDLVSGKPSVVIQLHDENKFLALNDTSKFKIYLQSPGSSTLERIYFSTPVNGDQLHFTQAVLPKNSCRIDWLPLLNKDGVYTLDVEAADKSNNESGKYNYRIRFEVVNKTTITQVLNYPNPFSTSTRFVFTLTGNEVPNYMKIQIMTISGKIVREITLPELGNIRVGKNITDYAWDGKDEFGDQLANGLYLYRVITRLDGEDVEKRESDVDAYFKKGWGKMYLMR